MPYDPDSGLVFSEKIIKKPKGRKGADVRDIYTRSLGQPPARQSTGDGSGSLFSIALRKLLCNLDQVDSDSLSTVPELVLREIWKAIQRSQLDSFHIWRVFAQSEIGQRCTLLDRLRSCRTIGMAIPQTIESDCSWLTTLNIATEESNVNLVRIAELRNLRRFHMAKATGTETAIDQGFNDRVLRTWAEQARQDGAFMHLQSIFLYGQEGITTWSLDRLSAFPALDEFCAYRCKIEWPQTKSISGWRNNSENGFIAFVESSKAYSLRKYNNSNLLSWQNFVSDYFNSRIAASKNPIDLRPVLNMQVRRGGSQGLRLDTLGEDIVCLQRCSEEQSPLASEENSRFSTPPATSAARPPMKKRKLVSNSTALEDMM